MPRFIVFKKSRHYEGGLGVDKKVYATEKEALEVAVEMTQRNPVGYQVLPYKPYPVCSVCGGPHADEIHTPGNV